VAPATGLRDVTGVEKLLQMQAEELQVCRALQSARDVQHSKLVHV
jgi:hypothetical protein